MKQWSVPVCNFSAESETLISSFSKSVFVLVVGSAAHHQEGIGNVPINIITTGGQTYAVASNLQSGIAAQSGVPSQIQIRSIAPNAATVVNQLQANHLTVQQIRGNVPQQRVPTVGKLLTRNI